MFCIYLMHLTPIAVLQVLPQNIGIDFGVNFSHLEKNRNDNRNRICKLEPYIVYLTRFNEVKCTYFIITFYKSNMVLFIMVLSQKAPVLVITDNTFLDKDRLSISISLLSLFQLGQKLLSIDIEDFISGSSPDENFSMFFEAEIQAFSFLATVLVLFVLLDNRSVPVDCVSGVSINQVTEKSVICASGNHLLWIAKKKKKKKHTQAKK